MFNPFERMVAARYLRARRQEGFISVIAGFSLLGIALGVATLIIVMAVMNGFRTELLSRLLGTEPHIVVSAQQRGLTDWPDVLKRLQALPGVVDVQPVTEGFGLLQANGRTSGGIVRGVRNEDFLRSPMAQKINAGDPTKFDADEDGIVIGFRLAKAFGLRPGDQLQFTSPTTSATPFGSVPKQKSFKVAATFDLGVYEFDSSLILIPMEIAQALFGVGQGVTALELRVTKPAGDLKPVMAAVEQAAGPGLAVRDWQQSRAGFFEAIDVERHVMFLILSLIIMVAAFNIISSMIMLVKDKGRDIAILRTMGATQGTILRVFFLTGASIGVLGTALGFVLGVLFCRNIEAIRGLVERLSGANVFNPEIYFLSKLPAIIEWNEVGQVVAMGIGLSFLATIYPAWRAARLDPVEALRYE
ncbi:lipoprotein-releasing ABC transporter permease subunit [Roseiterribacter gracilis]|uniref:LolC/E family lipoprotein releasing system, protein n=1 Tax=Roseiterribacter gracilis TaxID=2812848 RepID=A0A8S8XBG3_9PROT|nr:LolC/E family lipoprotein releasing system, protein [Rhodospirillales bacterium TMPK1]